VLGWCHVICALFIPEAWFGDTATMEPIILSRIPADRYNKVRDVFCELFLFIWLIFLNAFHQVSCLVLSAVNCGTVFGSVKVHLCSLCCDGNYTSLQ